MLTGQEDARTPVALADPRGTVCTEDDAVMELIEATIELMAKLFGKNSPVAVIIRQRQRRRFRCAVALSYPRINHGPAAHSYLQPRGTSAQLESEWISRMQTQIWIYSRSQMQRSSTALWSDAWILR